MTKEFIRIFREADFGGGERVIDQKDKILKGLNFSNRPTYESATAAMQIYADQQTTLLKEEVERLRLALYETQLLFHKVISIADKVPSHDLTLKEDKTMSEASYILRKHHSVTDILRSKH